MVARRGLRGRRVGIALPMVLMVLVALAMLSALALADGLQAARVAVLAEDELRARAAAASADSLSRRPPDLSWLCLQPPVQPQRRVLPTASGGRVELLWWMTASGLVRVQVTGLGGSGGRFRRFEWLRPDTLDPFDSSPGCPLATRLIPAATEWRAGHPEG